MKSLSISQIKPMPGFVLVEPAQSEKKTASGIILTETEGEKPQYGKVLACGDITCGSESCCEDKASESCCKDDKKSCKPCDMKLKKNDQVVYKKWGGNEVMIDDVEYQFLKYEDILAIVK
ncbi:MAG: co-chaperone GroES [Candidatus Pacebacteria bacterium]|jgi:chaperonin GroES|nr:co-chaperone GroES [Candidatus Paceibacterota bacterium]MBT4652505.1 co-chaperone GroES [Candidatus Paceibacterota bacterium]MBT6756332.1 co-chaperone GroES [Candidatus Paceibacterota bacterium]MBT6921623.1 co-chaperone GroES [Candidatus Paceibacterota bacterium]